MSRKSRLEALEQHFGRTRGGQYQLGLLCRALDGDQEAAREFEDLATAGKTIGLLDQMFDAIQNPVGGREADEPHQEAPPPAPQATPAAPAAEQAGPAVVIAIDAKETIQ